MSEARNVRKSTDRPMAGFYSAAHAPRKRVKNQIDVNVESSSEWRRLLISEVSKGMTIANNAKAVNQNVITPDKQTTRGVPLY